MNHDLLTTIVGTAPSFFGILFVIWQMGRVQDQLNKRIDDLRDMLTHRIDELRDTLRAEIRAAIAEARFK
jgi:hypothetical protein